MYFMKVVDYFVLACLQITNPLGVTLDIKGVVVGRSKSAPNKSLQDINNVIYETTIYIYIYI